ncbi:MAG: multiheme c-type cytochrome [Chloroflexota bacterium]
MKSKLYNLLLPIAAFAMIALAGALTSCEGPEGKPGTNGTNAAEGCTICHNNSTKMLSRQLQWAASLHATGTAFARSTNQCAGCHTSDGFRETLMTGADTTGGTIMNPTGQNCRTCHFVHRNYDSTDYELTTTAPVKLRINKDYAADVKKGNLCVKCHQPRVPSPMVTLQTTNDIKFNNNRWGPHESVTSGIFFGQGVYRVAGSAPYPDGDQNPHKGVQNGCIGCHMGPSYGTQAGGHTMKMRYDNEGSIVDNVAACNVAGCHSGLKNFDLDGVRTKVAADLKELHELLKGRGLVDEEGLSVPGKTATAKEAGIVLNFMLIERDKSLGVHNPRLVKALLTNSIEALK